MQESLACQNRLQYNQSMRASLSSVKTLSFSDVQKQLLPGLLWIYQLAAAALLVIDLALCLTWIQQSASTRWGELSPLALQQLTSTFRMVYLVFPIATGLIYLVIAIWVALIRRGDPPSRAFSFFATSAGLVFGLLSDLFSGQHLLFPWSLALACTAGSLLHLAWTFPEDSGWLRRMPFLRYSGFGLATLLGLLTIRILTKDPSLDQVLRVWYLDLVIIGLSFCLFLGISFERRKTSSSPMIREQNRLVFWSLLLSVAPGFAWMILRLAGAAQAFNPYLLLPLTIFPMVTAYTLLRYRFVKADYLASQAVLYGLLFVIIAVGYGLIVAGLSLVSSSYLQANNPFVLGALLFFFSILLIPLRSSLQYRIDEAFSRGQRVYRERLQSYSRELTQAIELSEILSILRHYVTHSLQPVQFHLFIHDPLSDQYLAAPDEYDRPTTDLWFSGNNPMVQLLASRREAVYLGEKESLPLPLRGERARLALLGTELFIPLPGRRQLIGWLAFGPRRSGEPYTDQDLNFLESISDQAALAIERAQVVSDLEQRMREMNILTRVSQGINITVTFDDILELIYTQTNQLIPSIDFRITLHDSYSDYLYHVFYLENDEREIEKENKPIPIGQGLELEVIRSYNAILTDDYERECRSRGVMPSNQGLLAWIGVPLSAGEDVIGVLSLGSRNPSVLYTDEQRDLLQAIADQAAGAIVKARLLQESQRRTRQLTSLNEVARSLTSTLELNRLLDQILSNAVEILNCEAGTLFLVDEQTDELVFEVVVGTVAADLLKTRLPPGTGLAGKAVETRQPVIANDVKRTKEWYEKPDQQTGFVTQDVLAVPMQVKDQVIGVIEVINRKDSLPFTQDDLELLAAFTSQAAVAIENARLYTLTDQALASRVEELSVMQRIDRELNASLDVTKTMQITLSWAMRQSGSDAGLVGILGDNGLQIMASQYYTDELKPYQDELLPLDFGVIRAAMESGQPECVYKKDGERYSGLLKGSRSQVAVPILRETSTIGIIFLEGQGGEKIPGEVLDFLSRLSDHAAVAITNAKLYAEVQAANLAKSEFVSFVSHELKTPMTSIKGFTDLIAAGVVGPVNEAQANFLNTIRSNVDRMATLVSDLADVSRIEAGRLRLDFSAVPVQEIVDEVVRSVHGQVETKKQTLTLNIPDDLPPMWGDRGRLIQVLTNLASNAYKYSPESGQITISAEAGPNRWDNSGAPKVIHLWVQDTGYGISPEDQQKIFQKFFRSEDQMVRDAPGTGLGLNITKTLVEMQGGQIWFESVLRQGTEFHFTVPIAETV